MTVETETYGNSKSTNERGPSLVGSLGLSFRYKRFLSCVGCSSRPCTKYFFITIHYFTSFVPIAQQAGQAALLGHQSLNMCLCSEHYLSSFAQNICINSVFRCRHCCGSRYIESGYIDFSLNPTITYQPPPTTDTGDQQLTTI
jgi:hypothetical protein